MPSQHTMRRTPCLAALVAVAVLCTVMRGTGASFCRRDANITGGENSHPIDTSSPVFVRRVPNGELWNVGTADDRVQLLHLYGDNGYDYGYAAGQLIGREMNATLHTVYAYFLEQVLQAINGTATKLHIPAPLLRKIALLGLDAVLDLQNDEDRPFIDPQVYAEMHGMADASGVDYQQIVRVHMIAEVTKASCSFYGMFRSATYGGSTLQLRALDWDMGTGLQNHPIVTVYHPRTPSMGHAFANVGWAGWIGVLTGMSSNRLGVTSIGISFPDDTFGNESYVGIPFIFLERNIVSRATSVFDAMDMIKRANRTCDLVLGVADGTARTARMVQYSYSVANVFNWSDARPEAPWHPRIEDTVYCAMDWICPYYQNVMADQLRAMHGRMTPALSIRNVTSVVRTGSLHVAVYDLTANVMYVANARGDGESGAVNAYDRQFIQLNMTALFDHVMG